MVIDTNTQSLFAQNELFNINNNMSNTMQQLSSGLRINSAANDPAGLAIAARMTSAVNGTQTAMQNVSEGINLLQTADGGAQNIQNILQTMNQLAVEASNGTNSTTDLQSLQSEFSALSSEINHIASVTNFNNINLLNNNGSVTFQVSNQVGDTVTASLYDFKTTSLGLNGLSLVNSAQGALSAVQAAINSVTSYRSGFGALENRLNYTLANLQSTNANTQASLSQVQDANMTQQMSNLTKYQILEQSSIAMLQQANSNPQSLLKLLS